MLPLHARLRNERARPPAPVELHGRLYDIMGVSPEAELLLRDELAIHQDVRIENFAGCTAILDGARWRVASLEATGSPLNTSLRLQLEDPSHPWRTLTITSGHGAMGSVLFPGARGEHTLGSVKHGIVRMAPATARAEIRAPIREGQRFEARLRGCELDGPYTIEVVEGGRLCASPAGRDGQPRRTAIEPDDIAPRYVAVDSLDFGASFDVDAFVFHEDQLRSRATSISADPALGPVQDPLLGRLSGATTAWLTSGAEHLAVMAHFIHVRARPPAGYAGSAPRRLTILNLSMSNQGDARIVLDALLDFRRQNPEADMAMVVSKLGPSEFQDSPEFHQYLTVLAANRVRVDAFTRADGPTRQVMHAKAIVIDASVLFSTGAVMDTRPINKADFSIELPVEAAAKFRLYTDEAVHGDASDERRAELAAQLACRGVLINDPVAGLPYISRAQDALIRGASRQLLVSISELVDPAMTQTLIDRAASGIAVAIHVRELDRVSKRALAAAETRYSNLQVECSSWWEPRPHFNAIVADGKTAYVGTSYLWPTQRNMVHQGRSLENGVLLSGQAAASVRLQIAKLRIRAHRLGPFGPPSRALNPSLLSVGRGPKARVCVTVPQVVSIADSTCRPPRTCAVLSRHTLPVFHQKDRVSVSALPILASMKETPSILLWRGNVRDDLDEILLPAGTPDALTTGNFGFLLFQGIQSIGAYTNHAKSRAPANLHARDKKSSKSASAIRDGHRLACDFLNLLGPTRAVQDTRPSICNRGHPCIASTLARGGLLQPWVHRRHIVGSKRPWTLKETALHVDAVLVRWADRRFDESLSHALEFVRVMNSPNLIDAKLMPHTRSLMSRPQVHVAPVSNGSWYTSRDVCMLHENANICVRRQSTA